MNLNEKRLAVIGAGNIGGILLKRLLSGGLPAQNLVVCDRNAERARAAAGEFGVRPVMLADEAVTAADAVLLAIPPREVAEVVKTFADWRCDCRVLISFAAAVPLSKIEAMLPPNAPVARVMPNAPSLVGKGVNPVAYGASMTPRFIELVETILSLLGTTIVVRDDQMNWCVGLTGAAMRSVLPALEGLVRAGVEAGFSETEARQMAAQVFSGAAELVLKTDLTFEQIKSLTPMPMVDETGLAQLFFEAARSAKEKTETAQHKLWPDEREIK